MPYIPQIKIGSTTYDVKDSEGRQIINNVNTEVNHAIDNLKSALGYIQLTYEPGYIDCNVSNVDINSVVASSGYFHVVDQCVEGTRYLVKGRGALSAKKWCFIDSTGEKLKYVDDTNDNDFEIADAPPNTAYFIAHYRVSTSTDPQAIRIDNFSFPGKAVTTDCSVCGVIPDGSNLNNFKTSGNFRVVASANAQTMINIPSRAGGLLMVYRTAGGSYYQEYLTTGGQLFKRAYTSGKWTGWSSMDLTSALTIPDNTDADTIKTTGCHRVPDSASLATMSNFPSTTPGKLIVMGLASEGTIFQAYLANNSNIFVRTFTLGAWTSWINISSQFSFPLRYADASVIEDGTDFNTIMDVGNYRVSTAASAKTMYNAPCRVGGRLTVLTLSSSGAYHQWYIDTEGYWYAREYVRGEWTPWKRFIMSGEEGDDTTSGYSSRSAYNAIHALAKQANYDMSFANAFVPLDLKNYMGNNQNVHPKVLYFANGFGDHKYWMAYTPYPYSNDDYENPCVAYSDDGLDWTNIEGNPLSDPMGVGYNSDTHLVYRDDTSTLEVWYRYVGPADQTPREETIFRRTTTDGVNWTAEEQLYSNNTGSYAQFLSPAVIWDNNKYNIWCIGSSTIKYYTAPGSDPTNWTYVRSYSLAFDDDGLTVNPWHMDIIKDGSTYVMLVMCRNGTSVNNNACSLFITTSSDNITYSSPYKVVEGGAGSWDRFMYRSTIVKIGALYRIYYSAGTGGTLTIYNKSEWGIGITESNSLSNFYGRYE